MPSGADMFADATLLSGTSVIDTGNNTQATAEPGELGILGNSPSQSLWWKWTAPVSGAVEVNTFGSDFDTLLGVYTGSTMETLTPAGANSESDDANSPQSQAYFDAVAGTTYYIAVDGFVGSVVGSNGNVLLHLGMTPPNDDFANATVVVGGSVTGSNVAATVETGEPVHAGAPLPINSVWWQWTATETAQVEVNTFGSDFDTVLAVYTGSSVDDLDLITANDDVGGGLQSQVSFGAIAGTTYAIAVDGFGHLTGAISLTLPEAPGSTNNPPVIGAQSFSVNENSVGGAVVGTVAASDPDAGQTLRYSIVQGNTSGAFSVNSQTGVIQVLDSAVLDYETTQSFSLVVQVIDNGVPALSASATVTINLLDVNEAPVLDDSGSMSLATVTQGATNNGTLVADILASAGGNRIADPDAGALRGIAVTATDSTNGTWQYSTNGGATWLNVGAVSNSSALLLAADANTRVRFVPATGFSGTVGTGVTFRAWDQTSGTNGGLGDTSVNGGSSGFSTATETASVTVRKSVSEQLQLLYAEVQNLVSTHVLTTSQGKKLKGYLDAAKRKYDQGNLAAAVKNLNSFVSQVDSYVSSGVLTATQGQSLDDKVDELILTIQG